MDLVLCFLELLLSDGVVLLSLGEIKLELASLTFTLDAHVLFPVLNTLGEPLLHEACIALELVNLDAAHLLLLGGIGLNVVIVKFGGIASLSDQFVVELLLVRLQVDIFLSTVELAKPLLEKRVGNVIVLRLAHGNALSGLVVTEGPRLGHNRDICGWVHLLEHHL